MISNTLGSLPIHRFLFTFALELQATILIKRYISKHGQKYRLHLTFSREEAIVFWGVTRHKMNDLILYSTVVSSFDTAKIQRMWKEDPENEEADVSRNNSDAVLIFFILMNV